MSWVTDIATSEFVWGIVIGLLLAVVVAAVVNWFDTQRQRRAVTALCQDLIGSVCDLIQNLEDNRDRNKVIEHEFLETIAAEIGVYARNREHLVLVSDAELQKDIRSFFTRVAALLAQVQWRLRQSYGANQMANMAHMPVEKTERTTLAYGHLEEAHKVCDRLREMGARGDNISEHLKRVQ